jgi:hypothetical protein
MVAGVVAAGVLLLIVQALLDAGTPRDHPRARICLVDYSLALPLGQLSAPLRWNPC